MKVISNDIRIDALLTQLSGIPNPVASWQTSNELGTAVSLNYGFLSSATNSVSGFQAMNSNLQASVGTGLALISEVANITFNQTSVANADVSFGTANFGGSPFGYTAGVAYSSFSVLPTHSWFSNSNVYITNADFANYDTAAVGSSAFSTLLHEIAHGLGLDHPFEGVVLPSGTDSTKYTVMSYTDFYPSGVNPTGLMLYDILAMQYLYGANTSFNSGNTTIALDQFLANGPKALWDGGGVDTLDLSAFDAGKTLSLVDGEFSSFNYTDDFVIAFGADIENAIGTSFDDTITGNESDNSLTGGVGDDRLYGGDGADVFFTGQGADTVEGGSGVDTVNYSAATNAQEINLVTNANVGGFANGDVLNGIENVIGSNTRGDKVTGTSGSNVIEGLGAGDILRGFNGDDSLYGGSNNDFLFGGRGGDLLDGGSGIDWAMYNDSNVGVSVSLSSAGSGGFAAGDSFNDVENIRGSLGGDVLTGDGGVNKIIGDAGADTINGEAGRDNLRGGNDADIIDGGSGIDGLRGDAGNDVFVFKAGNGLDNILDFDDFGNDRVDLSSFNLAQYSGVQSVMSQAGAHVKLDFGSSDILLLRNTGLASIGEDDFIL